MKYKIWYEEKRRITQYETLTVGLEREVDTIQEKVGAVEVLNGLKAFVVAEMPKALEEARKR